VHQQGLAAARRHPEGQLVQVRRGIGSAPVGVDRAESVGLGQTGVQTPDGVVQLAEQSLRVTEPPIQVDVRGEQGQVLEVEPADLALAAPQPGLVEPLGDRDDPLVGLKQALVREIRPLRRGQMKAERLVESVDIVRAKAAQVVLLDVSGEFLQADAAELAEQPPVEGELARERDLRSAGRAQFESSLSNMSRWK